MADPTRSLIGGEADDAANGGGGVMEDFSVFATYAFKHGMKRGFMKERSLSKYYSLFGNILFEYRAADPLSFQNVIFLEGSTIKASDINVDNAFGISIATVGRKFYTFLVHNDSEQLEWMDAFSKHKVLHMFRKTQNAIIESQKSINRVEERELELMEREHKISLKNEEHLMLLDKLQALESAIKSVELENVVLNSKLKNMELDKLNLLKSKGITPKILPLWAINNNNSNNSSNSDSNRTGVGSNTSNNSGFCPDFLKLWTGTWNLGSVCPVGDMTESRAFVHLKPFVPPGYDIYVLGLQECVGDRLTCMIERLLRTYGCVRLKEKKGSNSDKERSKIYGRDDKSLVTPNCSDLLVFVSYRYINDCRFISSAQDSFSSVNSQGAIANLISIFGKTIVFINCHLESKSVEARRSQYIKIVDKLGGRLAEPGYHLLEQFHHVIWLGDFNYDLVDASGSTLTAEVVSKHLEDGKCRTLFESNDQLNMDRRNQLSFFGFKEPVPFPNFYPTFKKVRKRKSVDYMNKSWVNETYEMRRKDPFYINLSGKVREFVPKFSDRILFYSIVDAVEDLVPECMPQDLALHQRNEPIHFSEPATSRGNPDAPISITSIGLTSSPKLPHALTASIDNYQAINDGEMFSLSDHSPVFGTFLLRLKRSYDKRNFNLAHLEHQEQIESNINELELNRPQLSDKPRYFSNQSRSSRLNKDDELFDVDLLEAHRSLTAGTGGTLSSRISESSNSPQNSKSNEVDSYSTPTKSINSAHQSNGDIASLSSGISPSPSKAYSLTTYSLLSPGPRKFRLSNIKLLWGLNESIPYKIELMFPIPFEAISGESFVQFYNESSFGAENKSSPKKTALTTRNSLVGNSGGMRDSIGGAGMRDSMGVALNRGGLWKQVRKTATGSGILLDFDDFDGRSGGMIPPLHLAWSGDVPLDRLHVAMKVYIPSSSFNLPRRGSDGENVELMYGFCAFGLEQLCKMAVSTSNKSATSASTPTLSPTKGNQQLGSVSVARPLVKDGTAMHLVDPKALSREKVTFCCNLELLSSDCD